MLHRSSGVVILFSRIKSTHRRPNFSLRTGISGTSSQALSEKMKRGGPDESSHICVQTLEWWKRHGGGTLLINCTSPDLNNDELKYAGEHTSCY